MEVRYSPDQIRFEMMNTDEIRESFLIEKLFNTGEIAMVYSDVDRVIVGSAVPTDKELSLEAVFTALRKKRVIPVFRPSRIFLEQMSPNMVIKNK